MSESTVSNVVGIRHTAAGAGGSRVDGGSLADLKAAGQKVLHSAQHAPILLIYHDDIVYAVDNRCPHMGFPLARGSVSDGIITCHWHHARFCLSSGGTFDPFADDLRTYPVEVDGDQIWVELAEPGDRRAYWRGRLEDGLRHGLNLVIAKAVTALVDLDVDVKEIVRAGAEFGCLHRRSWGPGLTILTAMANLAPGLPREDRILALYQGLVHVSRDTRGQSPRFSLGPLSGADDATADATTHRHHTWFRHFVDVRDEDGAERTLLTAIAQGASPEFLVDMLLAAATDHVYLDVGHVVDFINKSCELLDLIGWDESKWVLPSVVPLLCNAQRSEELASWRRPVDLIEILDEAVERLECIASDDGSRADAKAQPWAGDVKALSDEFLTDDPAAGIDALLSALEAGAATDELARALALAAAQRVLHFHIQNEFSDWDAVHHTFTYANALHQLLQRSPSVEGLRGLLHGVLRVYLDRFLNVPKARTPTSLVDAERHAMSNGQTYGPRLEELLNAAGNVDRAAALTTAFYDQADSTGPPDATSHATQSAGALNDMWAALVRTVVREDADFHTLQMVEAARRQFDMANRAHRRIPMVAASRYIAAHAPTHRELLQTARVAMRLQAGEILHEE